MNLLEIIPPLYFPEIRYKTCICYCHCDEDFEDCECEYIECNCASKTLEEEILKISGINEDLLGV